MATHDAIVLAGGSGRRLGGADKPAETVGGRSLLERALDAAAGAGVVVVVGPQRETGRSVEWVGEARPGGGPAAALAAGLPFVAAEVVLVLAADQPFAAGAPPRLLERLAAEPELDGVLVTDEHDRNQPLLAAYRTRALRGAVAWAGDLHGRPFRVLLQDLRLGSVPAEGDEALDCDTPADLALARRIAGAGAGTGGVEVGA